MTIDSDGALHTTDTGRFADVMQSEGDPQVLGETPARVTPKRGLQFTHHTFLDTDWKPGPGQRYVDAPHVRMVITRVSSTTVWYGHADDEHPRVAWRKDRGSFEDEYGMELEG